MLLGVFAEKADIGEVHFEGNLLDGEVGLQKVVFDVSDGAFRNPFHRRATAFFLADGAEVFGRHQ